MFRKGIARDYRFSVATIMANLYRLAHFQMEVIYRLSVISQSRHYARRF